MAQEIPIYLARLKVKPRLVAIFTRQLCTMLVSGVPLLRALETLGTQDECPAFGEAILLCGDLVAAGHNFSNACSKFPGIFPPMYITMICIGERVGQLDHTLDQLAGWMEKDDQLRQKILSALTYPALILAVAGVLTLGLFYTVLPGFVEVFREMNIPLPLVTRMVMTATDAVRQPGFWLCLVAGGVALVGLVQRLGRSPVWRARGYRWLMRVPVLGRMVFCGSIARFCGSSYTLLGAGLDMLATFSLAASASGSPLLEQDSPALVASIREGELVSVHLASRPDLYPNSLYQMVAAGEESSRLPELLERTADYFEQETYHWVDSLGAVIEPLLLSGVAVVIATIVLSIFLPMYSYIGTLSS